MAILEAPLEPAGPETGGIETLTQVWHVGVTFPGLFPFDEAKCPCDKAACGLVIVKPEIPCSVHTVSPTLRQAHPAGECTQLHRRRGLFRRR